MRNEKDPPIGMFWIFFFTLMSLNAYKLSAIKEPDDKTYALFISCIALMLFAVWATYKTGIFKLALGVMAFHLIASAVIPLGTVAAIAWTEMIASIFVDAYFKKKRLREEETAQQSKKAKDDEAKRRVQEALGGDLPAIIIDARYTEVKN